MTDIVNPTPLDNLPTAPQPTDTQEVFNTRSFSVFAALANLVAQINAAIANVFQNATAAQERANAAAGSAGAAAGSVNDAAALVLTAAGHVAAAEAQADAAAGSAESALAAAAAAGSAAGLPAFVGKSLQMLRVKSDEAGVEFAPVPSQYSTGDSIFTARALSEPEWVKAGGVYLTSAYPSLFAVAGDSAPKIWRRIDTNVSGNSTWVFNPYRQAVVRHGGASSSTLIAVGGPGVLYGGGASGNGAYSTDGGLTWYSFNIGTATDYYRVAAYSGGYTLALGDAGILAYTTNGNTWTKHTTAINGFNAQGLAAVSGTNFVAVGSAGLVYKITSVTVFAKITGPNTVDNLQGVATFADGTTVVAVGYSGVIWRSLDSGTTWLKLVGPNTVDDLMSVTTLSATTAVAVGLLGSVWRTNNAGLTWAKAVGPNTSDNLRYVAAVSTTRLVAVGGEGAIWVSENAGLTWWAMDKANRPVPENTTLYGVAAASSGTALVAVGSGVAYVLRAGGIQYDPATQFVAPYTTSPPGTNHYIKA